MGPCPTLYNGDGTEGRQRRHFKNSRQAERRTRPGASMNTFCLIYGTYPVAPNLGKSAVMPNNGKSGIFFKVWDSSHLGGRSCRLSQVTVVQWMAARSEEKIRSVAA
jgi:hypothetical protein